MPSGRSHLDISIGVSPRPGRPDRGGRWSIHRGHFGPLVGGLSDADIDPLGRPVVDNLFQPIRCADTVLNTDQRSPQELGRRDSCLGALQNVSPTGDSAILHLCVGAEETQPDSVSCCAYE